VNPGVAKRTLVVVGMEDERALAAGAGREVVVGAANATLLRARLKGLDPAGVDAVYSFGVAGALDPDLQPGALLVSTRVLAQGVIGEQARVVNAWQADPDLLAAFRARAEQLGIRDGVFLGTDIEARDNSLPSLRQLRADNGADIIDNESHIAAEFAARHGLPFIAVRAVSDSIHRALPPAALAALKGDGRPDIAAVAKSLLRHPRQLPLLMRTAREYSRALKTLRRFVGQVGFLRPSD